MSEAALRESRTTAAITIGRGPAVGPMVIASVAAASVVAKVVRDERFARIRARYEHELGPITGGGYANAATRRWLRAYAERYGRLPDEARLTWPHPYVEDLIGSVRPPGPQAELFS